MNTEMIKHALSIAKHDIVHKPNHYIISIFILIPIPTVVKCDNFLSHGYE